MRLAGEVGAAGGIVKYLELLSEQSAAIETEKLRLQHQAEVLARRGTFGELLDSYVSKMVAEGRVSAKEIDNLFRLQDRRKNDYLLGPTHEEMFTLTVKGEYSSYKDFPLRLYQIQTKYRDEARPRAGILRGREFIMKDSYSFDIDDSGLKDAYHAHREAYQRIFDRLAVRYVIVSAVSGAMGGSASEEFLAESEVGEDTFVRCLQSGYAANVEAVVTAVPDALPIEGQPEAVVYDTPDQLTSEIVHQIYPGLEDPGISRVLKPRPASQPVLAPMIAPAIA